MKRLSRVLTIVLACLSAASAAQEPILFEPATPRAGDVFQIQGTYSTSCPFVRAETEVHGSVIETTAVERCSCLPGLPWPQTFLTYAGPYAGGSYTAELWVVREEFGEACGEPHRLATRDFSLSPEGDPGLLSLAPFPATSLEPVRFTLRSRCPIHTSYDPPELSGRTITLVQWYNSAIAAPCVSELQEVAAFDVGPLAAAGTYTVRHFTVEVPLVGEGEPVGEPDFTFSFDVLDPSRLLLHGGRFAVAATWRQPSGTSGAGRPLQLTEAAGYFWFFDRDNVELVVKILDGCAINNRFWLFAAGLTNLEVVLSVTDMLADEMRIYRNPQGQPFAPVLATDVFDTCTTPTPRAQ